MTSQFPDDESGQILAEMAAEGIDLSQPMQIDFYAAFEFKETAEAVLAKVKQLDLSGQHFDQVNIQKPELGGGVELVASLTIVPDHQTISQIDEIFTACVESNKGYSDGWGAEIVA
ncbi:ribonuclease E inhibitor RraB [Catenovulum sp. 2E275]|uniref:ribonuclease E inhibitor RraB n=1 Tax=Catenovulum sp. 2E275 TaxID=2980497 RepID=UPI0021D05D7C|nr:ribonuclease E inhibitor RraB [Catenovulum sp. 2E275]MCU4675175.1 ribonuclease E inhibitor RraB [Catenovulum sp. 2E275]